MSQECSVLVHSVVAMVNEICDPTDSTVGIQNRTSELINATSGIRCSVSISTLNSRLGHLLLS